MSEAPKKPARKKPAPKTEAPKAERMDDQTAREAVLAAALPHAAFDGFTDSVLQKAAAEAGGATNNLLRISHDLSERAKALDSEITAFMATL